MTIAEDVPTRELPYWMRQAQRGVDWGVLLVIAFSLALAWPFLLQPGLPHTNASENYVYRTADYAQAIMEGRLYPRWSPHALSGYGAPIPHYYPPGAAYSAALVQVLFTGDATTAVRIVYAAALCLCGSMMYVFVTRRAGSSAGVLASVLYVSSPYVGMTIPHILGDLPGAIALALLPTLLWAVDRLLILNRPHDITLVAFTVAALVLTSPRDGAISLALAALLVVWHVWANDRHASWHLVVAGAALGIGMASFFWLPALLEQNAVQWRPADRPSDDQLSVKTLFAPLQLIDLAEMKPLPQLSVGLVGIGSALFGLLGALQARRQSAFQILFLIAGLGLIVLGLTAFTGEVWLLGPISLCLAISGSAVLQLGRYATASVQRLLLPASLIVILMGSLPVWLAPRWAESFGSPTPQAQIQYEQQYQAIAVLPPDAPVPVTIRETLPPNRSLTDGYLSGTMNKIAVGQLGATVRVGVLEHRTHSDRFQLRVTTPTTLNILTAFFPGWQATIADRPLPLSADPETGLIRVEVPVVSNEEMTIILGPTPARTGGWVIAWAALAITLILTGGRFRRKTGVHDDPVLLKIPEARLLALVLAWHIIFVLVFATPSSPLSLHARPGYRLDNSYSLRNRTDVGLEAIAYRLDRFEYRPGETLALTLYWQTSRPLADDYQVQIYLLNAEGIHWLPTPFTRPGNYSTRRWLPNRYMRDDHTIPLSQTIPPGIYRIAVEVYGCNPSCITPVSFFDADGRLVGRTLTLPPPINILP